MSTELTEFKKSGEERIFDKIKRCYKKLRSKKNFEIIVCVVIICIALLIYFTIKLSDKIGEKDSVGTQSTTLASPNENGLKSDLETTLGSIKGVGRVKVMISYNGSNRIVTAEDTTTYKTNNTNSTSNSSQSSEQTTTSPTIVSANGKTQPIILQELSPKIIGVLVVAEGADDIGVRIKIINAVIAVTEVNSDKIQVFTMK